MMAISVLQNSLDELDVEQLAALPALRKVEIQHNLAAAAAWLKHAQEKFADALERTYGEQCRQALKASGRDFGSTQLRDGRVVVGYELPKRVKWDQDKLHEIAQRITTSGENPQHYIEAKLVVPESKWKSWPPVLQEQFAPARTLEAGKPAITLRVDEGRDR